MSTVPYFISPTAQYHALVARFLAVFRRPCACPLDLRQDRGLRCASCNRLFTRRMTS